jgi:MFS family permease
MDITKATRYFTNSLFFLTGGLAIAYTISGVLVNEIIEHFGLAGAEQGYMNSLLNIGNTIAVISTIALHWKLKKTSMLVLSGFLIVVMMALTGLSVSFHMILAVSLALGFGLAWMDSYLNSCVVDANPVGSAKHQGALHGCYGIGALIAPVAIAALLTSISWQKVYLFFTPIILVTVIVYIIVLRTAGKGIAVSGMDSPKFSGAEIRLYLRQRKSVYLLLACQAYTIMQVGLFAWLVRYMSVQYGAETMGMGGIAGMWAFTTVSRFVVPRLPADSMKLHAVGAFAAGAMLFVGTVSDNPWMMCVMVGAGALASGHSIPTLFNKSVVAYDGNSLLPTSAMILTTRISGMAVPPVLGWISVYSMQMSMVVPAIAALVSGLFGLLVIFAPTTKQGGF